MSKKSKRPALLWPANPPTERETAIKDLDQQMFLAKVALADKWAEVRQVENHLNGLQAKYVEAVVALGKERGIDFEDQSQAWHFDGSKLEFARRAK